MAVHTMSAARRLCEVSGWKVSNLELQKLLYIAHMVHLGEQGHALIGGAFEAWDYGPVQPDLYHKAKAFGRSPVGNIFALAPPLAEGSTEAAALDGIAVQMKDAPPGRLVAITHWDKGAWAKYYVPGARHCIIPNESIRQEYVDRMNDAAARAPAPTAA